MPPMRKYRRRQARGPARKRFARRPRQVQNRQPVHYFKRSVYLANAVSAVGANNFFAAAYALNGIPNHTEFTALYDQYKITGVKLKFVPRGNSSDINTGAPISSLITVTDTDDTAVPSSIDQLTQYQSMKMTRSTQQQVRYWKPKFNVATVNTLALGINGKMNTTGWLDVTDDAVQHFGIKGVLTSNPGVTVSYDILVTLYLAFKNVR